MGLKGLGGKLTTHFALVPRLRMQGHYPHASVRINDVVLIHGGTLYFK
jgi:hypothetical protein